MFTLGLAVVVFAVFLAGVAREPRSFGNAVLLGLALALAALGVAERLVAAPPPAGRLLLVLLLLAVALGPFLIGCFLLAGPTTLITTAQVPSAAVWFINRAPAPDPGVDLSLLLRGAKASAYLWEELAAADLR